MNVKITNYLSSAVFLNLIANMVVGQSMVAPIRVADLNPTGASSPRSFTVGGAAADRLYFEWDNAITGGSLRRVYISSYDAGIDLVTKVSDWDDYTWIVATGPSIVYYTVSRGSLYYFTEIFWKGLDGSSGGYIFYRNFEKIRAENGVVKAGKLISNGSSPQTALNKGMKFIVWIRQQVAQPCCAILHQVRPAARLPGSSRTMAMCTSLPRMPRAERNYTPLTAHRPAP